MIEAAKQRKMIEAERFGECFMTADALREKYNILKMYLPVGFADSVDYGLCLERIAVAARVVRGTKWVKERSITRSRMRRKQEAARKAQGEGAE